jgi:hypothetical protein
MRQKSDSKSAFRYWDFHLYAQLLMSECAWRDTMTELVEVASLTDFNWISRVRTHLLDEVVWVSLGVSRTQY